MGFKDPTDEREKARRRTESEARLMGLLDYKEEAWLKDKMLKWEQKERQKQKAESWRKRLAKWESELPVTTDASEPVRVTAAGMAYLSQSDGNTDTLMV